MERVPRYNYRYKQKTKKGGMKMDTDIKQSEGRKKFDEDFDRHMRKVTPEERKRFLEE